MIHSVLYIGPAAATGSLKSLQVAHNRFSAPDGLAAFARLGGVFAYSRRRFVAVQRFVPFFLESTRVGSLIIKLRPRI